MRGRALPHSRPRLERAWREELAEFVSIPSVSADPAHHEDVGRAAHFVANLVGRAGGEAAVRPFANSELVLGDIRADEEPAAAPSVLLYGHFDVQPPGHVELWDSPPFELSDRDGWLYGRGIADDKGQLYALIKAAQLLKEAGALPVNLRVVCDGEEEIGGHAVVDFLAHDDRPVKACVIFDGGRKQPEQPEFSIGCRGVVAFRITVRTGRHELHSGMYGGAALNATHVLMQALTSLVAVDGLLADELREGRLPLSDDERQGVEALPSGHAMLEQAGAAPLDAAAARDFYVRTWSEPALDVNGLRGGNPDFLNTALPVEALARLTIRLAPGQDGGQIAAAAERLLRSRLPVGAQILVEREALSSPAIIPPSTKALQLASDAFVRALGVRPLFVRMGGTLPILPALAARGIPAVISGFALPESGAHAPNERMRIEDIERSVCAAQELFSAWGALA